MAFPASILSLADAIGSQFLSVWFGGSVAHSTGINSMKADLIATETKVGISETSAQDSPLANTVLASGTDTKSKWRQLTNAYIATGAAIAYSKLALTGAILNADLAGSIAYSKLVLTGAILNADLAGSIAATKLALGGANSVLSSDGATNSFNNSPTVANLTATAFLQAGTTLKTGARIYPGTLNGPSPGVQAFVSAQVPYLNSALAANTAITIASFPVGAFWLFDLTTGAVGHFTSNGFSTATDKSSDTVVQIAGADPGASSSKIWISLSSATLQVYNRYAAPHFLILVGFGAN